METFRNWKRVRNFWNQFSQIGQKGKLREDKLSRVRFLIEFYNVWTLPRPIKDYSEHSILYLFEAWFTFLNGVQNLWRGISTWNWMNDSGTNFQIFGVFVGILHFRNRCGMKLHKNPKIGKSLPAKTSLFEVTIYLFKVMVNKRALDCILWVWIKI